MNPVNAQMVEQMRKWVTRPAGSTGIGPGDALFGSFVGLFVRNIGQAERTLRFRTPVLHALNWPGLGFCRTLEDDEADDSRAVRVRMSRARGGRGAAGRPSRAFT